MRLILASASPRRAELLASAGFEFDVIPSDVDEAGLPGERPEVYALRVAIAKAHRVAHEASRYGRVVLGADTVVVVGNRILGKPATDADATQMLTQLSGVVHEVLTAVVLCKGERVVSETVVTRVRFGVLTAGEIAWYVATGEPRGKAGGYAIQGYAARFIDRIEGSWSNVVGLPVATVYQLLKRLREVD